MSQRASTTYGELSEDEQPRKSDPKLSFKDIQLINYRIRHPDSEIKESKFKSPKEMFKKLYSSALLGFYKKDLEKLRDSKALEAIKLSSQNSLFDDLPESTKIIFDLDNIKNNIKLDFSKKERLNFIRKDNKMVNKLNSQYNLSKENSTELSNSDTMKIVNDERKNRKNK